MSRIWQLITCNYYIDYIIHMTLYDYMICMVVYIYIIYNYIYNYIYVCVFKTMYYEICIATSWSSAMPALFSEAKQATWSLLHCCYQALLRWAGRRRRRSAPPISPLDQMTRWIVISWDIFDHKNNTRIHKIKWWYLRYLWYLLIIC